MGCSQSSIRGRVRSPWRTATAWRPAVDSSRSHHFEWISSKLSIVWELPCPARPSVSTRITDFQDLSGPRLSPACSTNSDYRSTSAGSRCTWAKVAAGEMPLVRLDPLKNPIKPFLYICANNLFQRNPSTLLCEQRRLTGVIYVD